jgi:chromate transporter
MFGAFTLLALQGFGGVLAVSQRMLCERKRWMSHKQDVDALALAQVLPGPNTCNLALIVGDRFFGWRGAFTALAALMTAPLALVLAITVAYAHYASIAAVSGAVRGMGAVSAGLIIGTGWTVASQMLDWRALVLAACIAWLAWRTRVHVVALVAAGAAAGALGWI